MGPFIPQGLINPDLSLFFAFVIGLGFGYVLEQGGFSNARKLAGVFYGYDFVVLRVFFTAAITAALGLLLFSYMGWVDYDMLYINPTFLKAAIVGGAIMGVGFILGGFCPGTSMVAAVIGKVDAMFFVVGMMIGIFFFGSFFDLFEPLYNGTALGGIFVFDSLGLGRDVFVLILVVIALAAFIITRKIEDSINGIPNTYTLFHPSYTGPFVFMLGMALLVFVLPDKPSAKWFETDAETLIMEAAQGKHYVEPDELAFKLLNQRENNFLLVDVRPANDFASFSLPGAINIPLSDVTNPVNRKIIAESKRPILFYSYGNTAADQAWMFFRRNGNKTVNVLNGGLNGFFAHYFGDREEPTGMNEMEQFAARFRKRAAEAFSSGDAAARVVTKKQPVKTIIEIQAPPAGKGGC